MKIVIEGDPVLRAKAKAFSVEEIRSDKTATLVKGMAKALSEERFGVAIAAPQVGASVQLFLVSGATLARIKKVSTHPHLVCFNPVIKKSSKKQYVSSEGCLSVPHKYGTKVSRPEKISMQYQDKTGAQKTYNASGFLAQIFQHEIDHLNGILYTDHALEVIEVDENMEPLNDADKDTVTEARERRLES